MRLPRLRFTVRWLMVVVALAGVGGWGYRMWRLSGYFTDVAPCKTAEAMYRQVGAMGFDLAQVDAARTLNLWSPQFGAQLLRASRERQESAAKSQERAWPERVTFWCG